MTSLSTTNLGNSLNQDDENRSDSFQSEASSFQKRQRTISPRNFQPLTTDNLNIQYNDDENRNDEIEHSLNLHYENHRLKQEKLLFITNILRFLIIFILAPIIYFLV